MAGATASEELGAGLIVSMAPSPILELPERIRALPGDVRARAERLYEVHTATAHTVPPPELEDWIVSRFASLAAVREQRMVHVTNRATLDTTTFAPLRARRPIDGVGGAINDGGGAGDGDANRLRDEIRATEGDPFCHPETGTPASEFGRVRGASTITGANAAAADEHHGVIVFDTHDPLDFDAGLIADVFATGREWARRAARASPGAVNYLLIWNCLWRAGGSIVHGHAQVVVGRGRPAGQLDRWRHAARVHRAATGAALVDDIVAVHRGLDLAIDLADGVSVVAHLTPVKEREVLVIGGGVADELAPAFSAAVAGTLLALRDRLGVRSFNLGLWTPPLDGVADDDAASLPVMARIVDRGAPFERPSDIGAMELYGSTLVSSDPFLVAAELREALARG